MIGKMTSGSNPSGLLNYCYYEKEKLSVEERAKLQPTDVRGEMIYIQNLSLKSHQDGRFDMEHLAKQFKDCADNNKNLKSYVWHQSFSFPEGENPSKEQIQEISTRFAKDFGFENNQLVVFRHNDTSHAHFHIVANRISNDGKTTAKDNYSHLRTGTFCRKTELELGLKISKNMKALQPKNERENTFSRSETAKNMRSKIDKHISNAKQLNDLKQDLKKEGIKMNIGRGVSFVDVQSGAKFKGSELGRDYSLMGLENKIQEQSQIQNLEITKENEISISASENVQEDSEDIDTSKSKNKTLNQIKDSKPNITNKSKGRKLQRSRSR